jgi:predicted ester cyclase
MTTGIPEYDLAGFADVPDYIYGITRAIWEDRGVGDGLDRYYAADINVRAPTGLTHGNAGVVAQTLATLHQFPDRRLVGEDVIWAAAPDRSFLSSHRLVSAMRHTGDGALGQAQGRLVHSRIIADCWVQDGMVKEEWLVRDQAAFARCLGTTPQALAQRSIEDDLRAGLAPVYYTPAIDRPSRYTPVIADHALVRRVIADRTRIWADKQLSTIRDHYFHGANLHIPGGDTAFGHKEIDRWTIGYLSSFPDAMFRIDSAVINCEAERAVRLSLRWSLDGVHSGYGHFGAPSGAVVHVMGISHLELTDGRVRTEWLVTDEVSVWKQILAGARPARSCSAA